MQNTIPVPRGGRPVVDMTGRRCGRLEVIRREGSKNGRAMWLCRCDCGEEITAEGKRLRQGHTSSCGCLNREQAGALRRSHGQSSTALFHTWQHMVARVTDSNATQYRHYGGRGIKIHPAWLSSFEAFARDMGAGHRAGLTIERIDVNGDYEPGNCRWATMAEQTRNTRRNRNLEFAGTTMVLADWCQLLGLNYLRTWKRLDRGWSVERALTTDADPEALACLKATTTA